MPNIYYLSTTGNDGNTGVTTGLAIKTFTRASQLLQAGDSLIIAPGTYAQATYGQLKPVNNLGSAKLQIIGDVQGTVFGTPGEVVIDGGSANYEAFLWFDKSGNGSTFDLDIKDMKFINMKSYFASAVPGKGNIFMFDTGSSKIVFTGCFMADIAAQTTNYGSHFGYFLTSTGSLYFDQCNFEMFNNTAGSYQGYFVIASTNTLQGSRKYMLKFTNCKFVNKSTVDSLNYIFSFGANSTTLFGTQSGRLRGLFHNCTFENASGVTSRQNMVNQSYNYQIVTLEFVNCNIKSFMYWYLANQAGGMYTITFKSCRINVYSMSGWNSSGNVNTVHIENSKLHTMSALDLDTAINSHILTAGAAITLIGRIVNCVLDAQQSFNGIASRPGKLSKCLIRNVSANLIQNGTGTMLEFLNCAVIKVGASFTLASAGTAISVYLSNSYIPNTTNITVGSTNVGNIVTTALPSAPLFDIGIEGVLIPEFDSPISGLQSAYIPCSGAGWTTLPVLVEANKVNTIAFNIKKTWVGGSAKVYYGSTLVATLADVLTTQNVSFQITPVENGYADITIFGSDGNNVAEGFPEAFSNNRLIVDDFVVTSA